MNLLTHFSLWLLVAILALLVFVYQQGVDKIVINPPITTVNPSMKSIMTKAPTILVNVDPIVASKKPQNQDNVIEEKRNDNSELLLPEEGLARYLQVIPHSIAAQQALKALAKSEIEHVPLLLEAFQEGRQKNDDHLLLTVSQALVQIGNEDSMDVLHSALLDASLPQSLYEIIISQLEQAHTVESLPVLYDILDKRFQGYQSAVSGLLNTGDIGIQYLLSKVEEDRSGQLLEDLIDSINRSEQNTEIMTSVLHIAESNPRLYESLQAAL